jgi:hypothetical protein
MESIISFRSGRGIISSFESSRSGFIALKNAFHRILMSFPSSSSFKCFVIRFENARSSRCADENPRSMTNFNHVPLECQSLSKAKLESIEESFRFRLVFVSV